MQKVAGAHKGSVGFFLEDFQGETRYRDQSNGDYARGFLVDGAWGTVRALWESPGNPIIYLGWNYRDRVDEFRYYARTPAKQQWEDKIYAFRTGFKEWKDGLSTKRGQGKLGFDIATILVSYSKLAKLARVGAAEKLTRAGYISEVEALKDLANSARAAGQNAEATARMVSAERNALKLKYRELSPADFVKQAEARNIEKYGNPLGPTVDQLRAQGKTWEQIIDSSARAGGKDLGL